MTGDDARNAKAIGSPQDFYPKAKAAAARTLELDGDLVEAHAALGAEKADFEYDWQGAEQEFKRAIELNPNYAEAHFRYAWAYLTPLGKSDQAIAEMKKPLKLDPFPRIYNTVFGVTYFYGRKYDQADEIATSGSPRSTNCPGRNFSTISASAARAGPTMAP